MAHNRVFFIGATSSDDISPTATSRDAAASLYPGLEVTLSNSDSHHLRDVLRVAVGTEIKIAHGAQQQAVYSAYITALQPLVTVQILQPLDSSQVTPPLVHTLVVGISKPALNELVCEKAAELGVGRLILWQSARTTVRIKSEDFSSRHARLMRIAETAAKQSAKNYLLHITFAKNEAELIVQLPPLPSTRLLCSLRPEAMPLRKISKPDTSLVLLVGPAGDLSAEEEALLLQHHFLPVSLGPYLLRSETAAITAVAQAIGQWA